MYDHKRPFDAPKTRNADSACDKRTVLNPSSQALRNRNGVSFRRTKVALGGAVFEKASHLPGADVAAARPRHTGRGRGQVLGPPARTGRVPARTCGRRVAILGRTCRADPRRTPRDLRPRPPPPARPEARAYLSPACLQYATMMSREWARRAESRGRVNVGSARDPAAGRSARRSGRGGAPDLPIPPPPAPPGPAAQPLLLRRGIPPRRQPITAPAGRPRLPIGSAGVPVVGSAGFRSRPAGRPGRRGAGGNAGPRGLGGARRGATSEAGVGEHPGRGHRHSKNLRSPPPTSWKSEPGLTCDYPDISRGFRATRDAPGRGQRAGWHVGIKKGGNKGWRRGGPTVTPTRSSLRPVQRRVLAPQSQLTAYSLWRLSEYLMRKIFFLHI